MNHHLRSACITLVVIVIASAGILGCTDSDPVSSIEDEAVPAGFHDNSDRVVAQVESASDEVSAIVDDIFRSIQQGTVENLYESSTAPKFREVASLDKFKAICERVQSRLGALKTKQSSRFDLNPIEGNLVASASYQARFEHGAGTIFVVFEKTDDNWQLLRLNVDAPELLDDPTQYRERIELFVENSDPVPPGTMVDVLDSDTDPPKVVVENLRVLSVQWKVRDPSSQPKFPASGFVTIGLTKDQVRAVNATETVSIRRNANADEPAAQQ